MSQQDEFGTPRDLAAAYVLGALSTEEQRTFEAHLAGDPATQRDVQEFREVAALLALAEPGETEMRADLRQRVAESARAGGRDGGAHVGATRVSPLRAPPSRGPTGISTRLPLYAALAASLMLTTWLGWQRNELGKTVNALRVQLDDQTTRLAERERTLNAILEPGTELYQLTSASGEAGPIVQLFWDRKHNRAVVHSFAVRDLPSDREYQLWFIKDGKPVPSVTFRPEPGGHAQISAVSVPQDGVLSAAAITEEPAGGSPQPTSPIYLVGSLERPAPAAAGGRSGA